jgi:hypothetical protein
MSHRNTPSSAVLVSARIEFIEQLNDAIAPYVIQIIEGLWVDSKRRVRAFQELLQGIPRWNSVAFEGHTRAIESRSPDVGDLIASVLIATVKMMASIKIGDGEDQIRVKIPTNDAFISKVFVKTARIFYESPDLIRDSAFQKRTVVQLAIERAIRDMLPVADLLASYTSGSGANVSKNIPEPIEEPVAEEEVVEEEIVEPAPVEEEYDEDEPVGETKRVEFGAPIGHQETFGDSYGETNVNAAPAPAPAFVEEPAAQTHQMQAPSNPFGQQTGIPPPPPPPIAPTTQSHGGALRNDASEIDW